MYRYGIKSTKVFNTLHPDLQDIFTEVIKYYDCSLISGYRGEAEQNQYFAEGKSHKKYPNSNHNVNPSRAVDATPFPTMWDSTMEMYYFAGLVMMIAHKKGIKLRWGGRFDWKFDGAHFELIRD